MEKTFKEFMGDFNSDHYNAVEKMLNEKEIMDKTKD